MTAIVRILLFLAFATCLASASGLAAQITTDRSEVRSPDTVIWSIRVSNLSSLAATGVTLKVTLPEYMTNNSLSYAYMVSSAYFNPPYSSPNSDLLGAGTIATYSLGALAPGASQLFQIALKPGYAPANGRVFIMSARVDSNNGIPSSETQASVLYEESDNSFVLSGESVKWMAGIPMNLVASYGYRGAEIQMNSKLEVTIPTGMTLVAGTQGYQITGNILSWNLGTLTAGNTGQRRFTLIYAGTEPVGTLRSISGGILADSVVKGRSTWPMTITDSIGLKTTITTSVSKVGPSDTVMWSIRVSNLSSLAATGVTLNVTLPEYMTNNSLSYAYTVSSAYFNPPYSSPNSDLLRAGTIATYSLGALAPGASQLFQIALKPGYAPANGRVFIMSARVDSNNGIPSSETQASVLYEKSNNSFVLSGESVKLVAGIPMSLVASYGYGGAEIQMNSKLEVTIPTGMTLVAGAPGYQITGNTLSWNLGTLTAGNTGQRQFTLIYSGTEPVGTLQSISSEISSGTVVHCTSTWPLTIADNVGLKTTIASSVGQVGFGDTVMWNVRVFNFSALAATGVSLKVKLPEYMTNNNLSFAYTVSSAYFNPPYSSPSSSLLAAGTIATYSLGTLAPGASLLFQIALKPGYSTADGGIFTMNARVDSNNGIPSSETQAAVPYAATTSISPTVSAIMDQTTNEDTSLTINNLMVGDLDTPLNSLTLSASSTDAILIPPANMIIAGTGASRTLTILPGSNASGSCFISFSVRDANATTSVWFKVIVTAVNDPPSISAIPNTQWTQNMSSAALPFFLADVDNALSSLTVSGNSSNVSLIPLAGISATGSGNERAVTLTPTTGQTGSSTISLMVSDGALSAATMFVATVVPGGIVIWRQIHFGAAAALPSIAGDNVDPDGDGVSNLMEYASGTSPTAAGDYPKPGLALFSNRLNFNAVRNSNAIDLTLAVEASDSLIGPWVTIARSANGGALLPSVAGTVVNEVGTGTVKSFTITDPNSVSASRSRFMRLKAGK